MADYRYTPDTTARIPNLIEALKSADRTFRHSDHHRRISELTFFDT